MGGAGVNPILYAHFLKFSIFQVYFLNLLAYAQQFFYGFR